tara:strand:+ start:338 stop:760 length:423 start_codon:yes stop_codon:yes gene_type:complete
MENIKISSNRSFGIVFFVVFLFISLYPLLNDRAIQVWSLIVSLIFLILGLTNSKILSPLNFENKNEILSQIEKDKLKLINKINLNLQKFNSKNFIFLDLVALMKNYKINEVFIDDCCHLSPFGAKKIADHINKIVSINND